MRRHNLRDRLGLSSEWISTFAWAEVIRLHHSEATAPNFRLESEEGHSLVTIDLRGDDAELSLCGVDRHLNRIDLRPIEIGSV